MYNCQHSIGLCSIWFQEWSRIFRLSLLLLLYTNYVLLCIVYLCRECGRTAASATTYSLHFSFTLSNVVVYMFLRLGFVFSLLSFELFVVSVESHLLHLHIFKCEACLLKLSMFKSTCLVLIEWRTNFRAHFFFDRSNCQTWCAFHGISIRITMGLFSNVYVRTTAFKCVHIYLIEMKFFQ